MGILYKKFQDGGNFTRAEKTVVPLKGDLVPKTNDGNHEVAPPIDFMGNKVASQELNIRRQKGLAAQGLYEGEIDGIWGPVSEAAWEQHLKNNFRGEQYENMLNRYRK